MKSSAASRRLAEKYAFRASDYYLGLIDWNDPADPIRTLGQIRSDWQMEAGTSPGTLTTRPVLFRGKHLFVNVDADEGELRVEVLDRAGQVTAPFSRESCLPVQADKTLATVTWKGVPDLPALVGRPVRFRFHLQSGALYAFWVTPSVSGASYGYVGAGGRVSRSPSTRWMREVIHTCHVWVRAMGSARILSASPMLIRAGMPAPHKVDTQPSRRRRKRDGQRVY